MPSRKIYIESHLAKTRVSTKDPETLIIGHFGRHTDPFANMSNLLRRASDAFRHHQHHLRKDSEDSVNQETVVSPSQEPQERVDQVEPQAPLLSPNPQEQKIETAAGLKSEGNAEAKAGLWSLFCPSLALAFVLSH